MHTKHIAAALALAAAGLAIQAPAPAAVDPDVTADGPPGLGVLSTDEADCFEVPLIRVATVAKLRNPNLGNVPARYELVPPTPTGTANARVAIHTYTCDHFTVTRLEAPGDLPDQATQPATEGGQPTTITIGSAEVASRDGVPTDGFAGYVLWYGTDNRVLFLQLRRLGLPAHFLPDSTVDVTRGDTNSNIAWSIRGDGLDYTLPVTATEPAAPTPAQGGPDFYYDAPDGRDLTFAIQNRELASVTGGALLTGGPTAANLTQLLPLAAVILNANMLTIPAPGVASTNFNFVRGSWTGRLTVE